MVAYFTVMVFSVFKDKMSCLRKGLVVVKLS